MIEQEERRAALTGIRRVTAKHLAASHVDIPRVLIVEEADVTGLPMSRLVGTVLHEMGALASAHPALNAHYADGELVTFDRSDIAVAVDTPRGLMVPVVRDCANRAVDDLQADVADLARRAREGTLAPGDVRGATITLTSPGKQGGVLASPLVNPPQTAIVGVHRAVQRVVPVDGELAVRTICNLTLTFDHRVADGVAAGAYVLGLARRLEQHALEAVSA